MSQVYANFRDDHDTIENSVGQMNFDWKLFDRYQSILFVYVLDANVRKLSGNRSSLKTLSWPKYLLNARQRASIETNSFCSKDRQNFLQVLAPTRQICREKLILPWSLLLQRKYRVLDKEWTSVIMHWCIDSFNSGGEVARPFSAR